MSVTSIGAPQDWSSGPEFDLDVNGFWAHVTAWVSRLGKAAVEKLLVAYYVAIDEQTPPWARASLIAALAYFGLPIDVVPDVIPVIGFSDDMAVLASALVAVGVCIRWRHVRSARNTMRTWGMKVKDVDPEHLDEESTDWNKE